MPIVRRMVVCALVTCIWSAALAADDPQAAARASLARIEALRAERPGDGTLVLYQALVHVGLGEKDAALAQLRSLKGRRLGLIPVRDIGFEAIWDDAEFQALRKELMDEELATPESRVAFRLQDPRLIPEGIAHDALSGRFFVGSIAQHKIIAINPKGAHARDFSRPQDKLDAVLGLAVDAKQRHLYAVSTNGFEDSAKTERRNAVVRYDLTRGRLIERFAAPDAMQLNDIALCPDGTLYATDSASHSLFRRKPGESTFTRFGAAGGLRGANGIALGADGALYVTLSTGIARVDTSSGEATRLPQPDTVATGGIDGLYWHDGDLVGVQNSTNPGRVIRIALADKGTRIAGVTVLQSHHHPEFVEPTTGTVVKGTLYVLGNTYVGHYQPDGSITGAGELKPTAIVAVPLRR